MAKIAIGCDHIVVEIKNKLVVQLEEKGHEVIDKGTYNNQRTHYPIFGQKVALAVVNKEADFGIVICGTGVGITNAANKIKGARTVLARDILTVEDARKNSDANILGFGGNIVGIGFINEAVDKFISTSYDKKNDDIVNILDSTISKLKESDFKKELKKWDSGEYHD